MAENRRRSEKISDLTLSFRCDIKKEALLETVEGSYTLGLRSYGRG